MKQQTVQPIHPNDVRSLTDFVRSAREAVAELQEHGRPVLLTVKGRGTLVVQDASAYQRVLELADRMEMFLTLRDSVESMQRGEGVSLEAFETEMRAKHGLPDIPRRRGATGTEGH